VTVTAADMKAPPSRLLGKSAGAASRDRSGQEAGCSRADPSKGTRRRASPRLASLAPMRKETARSLRTLAAQVQQSHPDLTVHEHLHDAAKTLEAGNEEGAQRHLRLARLSLTAPALRRHGIHDDGGHIAGQQAIDGIDRHVLLTKDIADANAANQAAIMRDSYGDDSTAPPRRDPNAGYGPGALAQKPVARQPPGDQALNAPARTSAGRPDPNVASPDSPQPKGSKQFSYDWGDLAALLGAIDLSARTPMLETTPAPRGRPGGPGLYRLKDNKHSDYLEQVVRALIQERGMPADKAYAIAWASLRRWNAKSRHPEVRAAAGRGLAGEEQAAERARAAHGHAVTWDDLGGVIDLAVVDVKTYQRTVNTKNGPVTQVVATHDQNYKNGTGQQPGGGGSSGGAQQGQQNGKAPYRQLPSRAAEKQRLLATARSYRQRAALLGVEVAALNSALYNALYGSNTTQATKGSTTSTSGSTTAAQAGSTTKATTAATTAAQQAGTTATTAAAAAPTAASTAPASTGTTAAQAGATTASQAGSTTAATAGSTTKAAAPAPSAAQSAATAALSAGATQAQVTQAKAQATKAAAGMSAPQLRTAIGQLQARISWYNSQASAMTAQAAKLP